MSEIPEFVCQPHNPELARRARVAMEDLLWDLTGTVTRERARAAERRIALYRLGFPTPFRRQPIDDWLGADPPGWEWRTES